MPTEWQRDQVTGGLFWKCIDNFTVEGSIVSRLNKRIHDSKIYAMQVDEIGLNVYTGKPLESCAMFPHSIYVVNKLSRVAVTYANVFSWSIQCYSVLYLLNIFWNFNTVELCNALSDSTDNGKVLPCCTAQCWCFQCDHSLGKVKEFKGEGKRFLHGKVICRYKLSEYIYLTSVYAL